MTRKGLWAAALTGCLLAAGLCAAQRAGAPSDEASAEVLLRRAAEAERAARTNEAVTAYERALARDSAFEPVVAPRLVELCVGCGRPADALAWAARVARRHPDPQPYLAGVHARLGQYVEAEQALRGALGRTAAPERRATLLWQLSDVLERQGRGDDALATLDRAAEGADDASRAATARLRTDLERRLTLAREATKPRPDPKTEVKP